MIPPMHALCYERKSLPIPHGNFVSFSIFFIRFSSFSLSLCLSTTSLSPSVRLSLSLSLSLYCLFETPWYCRIRDEQNMAGSLLFHFPTLRNLWQQTATSKVLEQRNSCFEPPSQDESVALSVRLSHHAKKSFRERK